MTLPQHVRTQLCDAIALLEAGRYERALLVLGGADRESKVYRMRQARALGAKAL